MKSFLLHIISISFLFPLNVFSQEAVLELFAEPEQIKIEEKNSEKASLFFDAGSLLMPIRDISVNGLMLKLGGTNGRVASGFAFDFIPSSRVFLPSDYDVTSPTYTSFFFGWDYEYICNPKKKVNMVLAIKSGFGYSEYSDNAASSEVYYYEITDSSSYHTPVSYYSSGLIVSNTFFSIQAGLNVLCNLTDWIAVGAGFNPRIVFAIDEESTLRDDGYYAGNLFLRFTLPGRED